MWRFGWYWFKLKEFYSRIKDYERLSYDYSCVLMHATSGRMSKTNYNRDVIYGEIDDAQSKFWYSIIKSDIQEILSNNKKTDTGKINDLKKYLKTIEG